MPNAHYILGTAGHIDHGKSALVKALTGVDPDRLPEEKARGMTIDLGFAHLDLPRPGGGDDAGFSLGIVDVPGHADFVKNMVAGVGGIDVALLAIAADDSWMPQTEEHVQILTYLKIKGAVVALTKADLVDDLSLAEMDVREHLEGTAFEEAPIVPTSVVTGAGIDELRGAIAQVLSKTEPPDDFGKPRLPVDRTFTVKGIGTVVTGTLTGGSLRKGQPAVLQPHGIETRIRNLQSHNRDVDVAVPGTRTAVNLHGIPIATRTEKQGVSRGDVVAAPESGAPTSTVGVLLAKLDREIPGQPGSARPLRHGMPVRFHHGGAAEPAKLFFLDPARNQLGPGDSMLAQIRFDRPVYCLAGDRFVLRDWGMHSTLAGGVILDPAAERRRYRAPEQRAFLASRAEDPDNPGVFIASRLTRDKAARRRDLLRRSRFQPGFLDEQVDSLVGQRGAVTVEDWLIDPAWWGELTSRASELIDSHHASQPQAAGMRLDSLSSKIARLLPDPGLFPALIQSLTSEAFHTAGQFILRRSHQPKLPPDLEKSAASLRDQLTGDPFNPPGLKELLHGPDDDKAFRFLVDAGEAVKLNDKVALGAAAFDDLVGKVRNHIEKNGPASASDLRQATGTTRRVLIPLLERLDADGVTRRHGDLRALK